MNIVDLMLRGDVSTLRKTLDVERVETITNSTLRAVPWVQYNPTKPIKRWGLPITSASGKCTDDYSDNGLHSLKELFGNSVIGHDVEGRFNKWTDLACRTGVKELLLEIFDFRESELSSALGRCHIIKLDAGGFFPYHRDGNLSLDHGEDYLRLFIPLKNCGSKEFVWLQQERKLHFQHGRVYFINTYLPHCVFSMVDDCRFLVLNLKSSVASRYIMKNLEVS